MTCSLGGESQQTLAHDVLSDVYLFSYIASFQRGFPRDIVDLVRANDTTFRPRGWLPALVAVKGDLRMLQRLYKIVSVQSSVFFGRSALSFGVVWLDALQAGKLEIAEWVDTHPNIRSDHEETVTLRFAITSARVDVVEWVLQRRPEYKALITPEAIEDCPTMEMLLWLEANVKPLPSLKLLVDRAAEEGRLELVRYVLTTHSSASCSSRAIVGAASKGHLHVVKFLHAHAHDQCSSNAMRAAAWYGHVDVVQYLNEQCSTAHGDAFELAALSGHLDIVRYLVKTRTDVRIMRAHSLVQQSGQHCHIQAYLSAIVNPAKTRSIREDKVDRTKGTLCGLL